MSAINGLWSYDAAINPTNEILFTYLPGVARNFEIYKFLSLSFEYVPMCGTGSVGNIHMAIDADPDDPPPQDKQSLMAMDGAVSLPAWTPHMFHMPRRLYNQQREYFIRNNSPDDDAAKFYDCGRLVLLSQSTSAYSMGELYVHYSVELRIPQVHPLASSDQISGPATAGRASILEAASHRLAVNGHVSWFGSTLTNATDAALFCRPNRLYALFVLGHKTTTDFDNSLTFNVADGATYVSSAYSIIQHSVGAPHWAKLMWFVKSASYPSYVNGSDGKRITYYGQSFGTYAAGDVAAMAAQTQTFTIIEVGSNGPLPPASFELDPEPEPRSLSPLDPTALEEALSRAFPQTLVIILPDGGTTRRTFRSKTDLARYAALMAMEDSEEDK